MTSAISGIVTLLITTGAIVVHFTSHHSDYESDGCKPSEVYRISDRACYTPQGE